MSEENKKSNPCTLCGNTDPANCEPPPKAMTIEYFLKILSTSREAIDAVRRSRLRIAKRF